MGDDGGATEFQIRNDSYSTGAGSGLVGYINNDGTANVQVGGNAYENLNLSFSNGSTTITHTINSGGITLTSGAEVNAGRMTLNDNGSASPTLKVRTDDNSPWAFEVGNDSYNSACGFRWYQNNDGHFYQSFRGNSQFREMYFQTTDGSTNNNLLVFDSNRAVKLYYQGNEKFATTTRGVYVTSGNGIEFGNGTWTGNVAGKIQQHSNWLYIGGGTSGIVLRGDGTSDRWYVRGAGTLEPAANNSYDIGTSSVKVRNIYAQGNVKGENVCKAFINFNQGNNNIRLGINISSINDNGTGQHRITFTTAMSNNYYTVVSGGSRDQPESSRCYPTNIDGMTSTYFDATNHNDGSTNVDWELCCLAVYGN